MTSEQRKLVHSIQGARHEAGVTVEDVERRRRPGDRVSRDVPRGTSSSRCCSAEISGRSSSDGSVPRWPTAALH